MNASKAHKVVVAERVKKTKHHGFIKGEHKLIPSLVSIDSSSGKKSKSTKLKKH